MKRLMIAISLMAASAMADGELKSVTVGIAANFSALNDTMWNAYANYFRQGVDLALSEMKPDLTRKGLLVTLQEFDHGNQKLETTKTALDAVKSSAVAVIGYPYSSEVLLSGPVFQENKLLLLSPSATADRVGELGRYVRTCSFSNAFQGVLLSQFTSQKSLKNIAMISIADCAYCQSLRKSFQSSLKEDASSHISVDESILENEIEDPTTLDRLASRLKKERPSAIFLPNYERVSATLIASLYDRGVRPKIWFGGDGWGAISELFTKIVGKRKIRGYTIAHWHKGTATEEGKRFLTNYRNTFKRDPDDIAAVSYEATKLLLLAMLRAKEVNRETIVQEMEKMTTVEGLTGPIRFKPGKTVPQKDAVLLSFEHGKVSFAGRLSK